jgi:hypothetical protein
MTDSSEFRNRFRTLGTCVVLLGLGLSSAGCRWMKIHGANQALGSDGGTDAGAPVVGARSPITFSMSPSAQTVHFQPDTSGFYDHDFCRTNVIRFTATLTNTGSQPVYVSPYVDTNLGLLYLNHGTSSLTGVPIVHSWIASPDAQAEQAITLLQPGAHVDYAVPAICPVDSNAASLRYPYDGAGTYTLKFTYHYRWRDAPIDFHKRDAGPNFDAGGKYETFHGTLASDELTIYAK